jgi:hypothetical protein
VAAAIKLVPILGAFWLAGKRDWRGLWVAIAIPLVATLIVVAWKGPETLVDFIVLRLNQITPEGRNSPPRWGLADVTGLPNLVVYAIGAALAALAWRRASFSLAVLAMLAASPALHVHYWTWFLVPFIGIWMPWLLNRSRARKHEHRVVSGVS